MERSIVHMDLDSFFVSCARLMNSKLEGIPLIIGGGSDRGVVASCSYEARVFGVRSGMPTKMALKLCPQALVLRGDMDLFMRQSAIVTEILTEKAPVLEKASIDEFYIDVSGMDKFFGCYKWTDELIQKVKEETGLPMSFGLSVNKTVSKIATGEAKPMGKLEVPANLVRPFLNPLSIQKIPMVGETTYNLLSRIGIRKIQTLAETPVDLLFELLGQNGTEIWRRSNGIDLSPVEPYTEKKSISTETTFDEDSIDIPAIKRLFVGMVEKLAYELRADNWVTSCITVKIRYTNFDTHTKQSKVQHTSLNHVLQQHVERLFEKVYDRRMRIRLIGVKFSSLERGGYQIDAFDDTAESMSLYQSMDRMKNKYGFGAITTCAAMEPKPKRNLKKKK